MENGFVGDPDGRVKGFPMAAVDRKFHWADATIQADAVVVSSLQASDPIACVTVGETVQFVIFITGKACPPLPFALTISPESPSRIPTEFYVKRCCRSDGEIRCENLSPEQSDMDRHRNPISGATPSP